MKNNNYIRYAPYLRNSKAYNHICKMIISSGVFFSFFENFDFLCPKGKKRSRMTKNCLMRSISQEPYIIWLSFMVQMYKMIVSPVVFFNLNVLIFQVAKELKGQKMVQNDKNFCLSHFIFQESSIIWSLFMAHTYV